MFNQQPQKPAFKFVIKSKIDTVDSSAPSKLSKQDDKTTVGSIPNLDDRKRKRPANESVTPIATKKVYIYFIFGYSLLNEGKFLFVNFFFSLSCVDS